MNKYIERLAWGTDAGFYRIVPQEVLHPADEQQVVEIIHRAHRENKQITFRAAGTSLSGQACGPSLLVVCGKKWEQYEVLDEGKRIRLQPGIVGQRVNDILRPYGRRFTPDPASIKSAMVGGIVMNNASGMVCGTHANSYRMLDSVRIVLADGTVLDTADEQSKAAFRRTHAPFIRRIEELRDRTRANAALTERIRKKYSIKNVTGLTILPFIEYDDPFDIIAHLMVGSEGTLAFLSEIVMRTGEDYKHTASSLLLFPTTESACRCVTEIKSLRSASAGDTPCGQSADGETVVAAMEYFDRYSMRVVEEDFPELKGLPEDAGAELMKIEAPTAEELKARIHRVEEVLAHYDLLQPASFTQDPALVGKYWGMRSGIFPAVGGTRPIGTTCLIEDIAFPIEYLAEATGDLQALFKEHHYPDAVIYGHAFEGNYHFILNQRFDTKEAIAQYDNMMHAVVDLVVDKYHGSLKAEHGTGRNMAPFVRREWGDDAYQLMCNVKHLFDPENIMNPGVIFNEDPVSYIQHIKPLPEVNALIDRCIECGFCEVNCVTCGFALSSRQRIVVSREIARLHSVGQHAEAEQLQDEFRHMGKDLCAGDGLCATSCPLHINTGEWIHVVREREMSKLGRQIGTYAADHLSIVADGIGSILSLAGFAHSILGDKAMSTICKGLHYGSGKAFPLWTTSMPRRAEKGSTVHSSTSSGTGVQEVSSSKVQGVSKVQKVVYFPSCINQRMGMAKGDIEALLAPLKPETLEPETARRAQKLAQSGTMGVMVALLQKAGYEVIFPENMQNLCCGTTWESKGMPDIADQKGKELHEALLRASDNGRYPILCDQSPCLYRMVRTAQEICHADAAHSLHGQELHFYEPAEFIAKFLLDKLPLHKLPTTVAIHPTCSTRKMNLVATLRHVAEQCAERVILPEEVGCCAFAGDKGFTNPEVNEWALRKLRTNIEREGATLGFSNSRTCEIGLSHHSGIHYMNIAWLVYLATETLP